MMKKIAFIVVVAACAFWACDKENPNTPIEKIEFGFIPEEQSVIEKYGIKEDGIFVGVNNSKVTNVNQFPVYAKRTDLKYSSENEAIVKINELGIITGVGKGEAFVYAESTNSALGLEKTKLKVYVDTIPVEKVTFSLKASSFDDHVELQKDTLFLNDTAVMSVVAEPLEASFADYVWESSNPSVLEVNGNVVTAKTVGGPVTISGNLKYKGTESTKKEYTWVVEEAELKGITVKKVNKIKILPLQSQPLMVTFDPQYASYKDYTAEYFEDEEKTKVKVNPSINISNGNLFVTSNNNNETTYVVLTSVRYPAVKSNGGVPAEFIIKRAE
jgi:hypothetical protein